MKVIQILSALLTPIIAIITTYIAIQQYRHNKAKLRHELYDKRFAIHMAMHEFILAGRSSKRMTQKVITTYLNAINPGLFLVDEELSDFLRLLWRKGKRKHFLEERKLHGPPEEESSINVELVEIERWFDEHRNDGTQLFKKYLDLESIK